MDIVAFHSSFCCCSVTKSRQVDVDWGWLLATSWTAAHQASFIVFNVLHCLLKFAQTHVIELMMSSNHVILCCPFFLLSLIFPSIRVPSNESALHIRWLTHWSISFSITPSNKYPGLISFRIDWFGLLALQGTLKSLLQPQFKCIDSLVLSLLYGPTLTSVYEYWKSHSFDYIDLCWQSDVSGF